MRKPIRSETNVAARSIVLDKIKSLMAVPRAEPIDVPSVLLPKLMRAVADDGGEAIDAEVLKREAMSFVPMIGSFHLSTLRSLGQHLAAGTVQVRNTSIVLAALQSADSGIRRSMDAMSTVARVAPSNVHGIAMAVADAIDPPHGFGGRLSPLASQCAADLMQATVLESAKSISMDEWRSRAIKQINRYVEAEIDWLINRPLSDHWMDVIGFGTGGRYAFEESAKKLAQHCAAYISAPMLEGRSIPIYLHNAFWKTAVLASDITADHEFEFETLGEIRAQLHESLAVMAVLRPIIEQRLKDDHLMWEVGSLGLMHAAKAQIDRAKSVQDRSEWSKSVDQIVLPITRDSLAAESTLDAWDGEMRRAHVPLNLVSVALDSESSSVPKLAKSFYTHAAEHLVKSAGLEQVWSRAAAGHVEEAHRAIVSRFQQLSVAHERTVTALYPAMVPAPRITERNAEPILRQM